MYIRLNYRMKTPLRAVSRLLAWAAFHGQAPSPSCWKPAERRPLWQVRGGGGWPLTPLAA